MRIRLIIFNIIHLFTLNNLVAFYGIAEKKGLRPTMEDAHSVNVGSRHVYFGLFDGHGGRYMADYAAKYLHKNIILDNKTQSIRLAIEQGFQKTHDNADKQLSENTGCTALVALLVKDEKYDLKDLYIASVGDSRAVLSLKGTAIPLSFDHKPDRPDELERIKKLGGFVRTYGVPRTMGILAMSRALGDKGLAPYVIPTPEIYKLKIDIDFEFIILACDGVWDVLGNQEAVDIVQESLKQNHNYAIAAGALIDTALKKGSTDNVSALVISFQRHI